MCKLGSCPRCPHEAPRSAAAREHFGSRMRGHCSICLEAVQLNSSRFVLDCDHVLHLQCAALHAHHGNTTCPECRFAFAPSCLRYLRGWAETFNFEPSTRASFEPPPRTDVVAWCCFRLFPPSPDDPNAEAVDDTNDRRMYQTNEGWLCMRCNTELDRNSPLCLLPHPRPICTEHGPRALLVDNHGSERFWVCAADAHYNDTPQLIDACGMELLEPLEPILIEDDGDATMQNAQQAEPLDAAIIDDGLHQLFSISVSEELQILHEIAMDSGDDHM